MEIYSSGKGATSHSKVRVNKSIPRAVHSPIRFDNINAELMKMYMKYILQLNSIDLLNIHIYIFMFILFIFFFCLSFLILLRFLLVVL